MKSLFSKLLPLLFIAMLSFAPTNAQAAGPTNGMFDCLGNLDWGCRIIGFLFQTTDNEVTYFKDGAATTPESPTPAIVALHGMMEFFSNALLVFASIKLLYELIQMTAESAQTGKVGGKDTNQLWAPIRLVIAIGLLVPLADSGGLNSGQMIVLQIAKWGSGMASQAWKVFVVKLSDGQSMTTATAPRIRTLAMNTLKSFACQAFINYYAKESGATNDIVTSVNKRTDNTNTLMFKNKNHEDVCGYIRYKVPLQTYTNNEVDGQISLDLTKGNFDDFIATMPDIGDVADDMVSAYLPYGRNLPKPSTQNLEKIIDRYQEQMRNRIETPGMINGVPSGSSVKNYAKNAMDAIIAKVKTAADTQGWTSAGTWFLAITRAQGQIINGAANIPEAAGPHVAVFSTSYASAFANYSEFVNDLNTMARPGDTAATTSGPIATPNAGYKAPASDTERSWENFLSGPSEALFWALDKMANLVGLWDPDPKKAFGDLGASTNPFAEIAALGHKKIQLALTYVGLAAGSGILGFGLDVASRGFGLNPLSKTAPVVRQGLAAASGIASGLTALLMMIATLFFLAGVLLAFIVPLFPFTRFFFSILTWLGSLMEAMILVPFMALAFLTPKGEGIAGPNTRNAFFLIFQVFLRPILCLFGLMAAMILFYIAAKFLNASFYDATSGIGDYAGNGMRFMQKLVYSVMYVGLIYSAANISFKMIEHIPKHALKWMGGSASEESYDDHNNFMSVATAVGGSQLLGQFQSLPEKLMSPAVKGYENRKSHNDAALANYRQDRLENSGRGGGGDTGSQMPGSGNGGPRGPTGGGTPGGGAPPGLGGGGGRGGANHFADPAAAPLGSGADDGSTPPSMIPQQQQQQQAQAGGGNTQQLLGAASGDIYNEPIQPSLTKGPARADVQAEAIKRMPQQRQAAMLFSQAMSGVHSMGAITSTAQAAVVANAINAQLAMSDDVPTAVSAGHNARQGVS